ncbi:MAG: hypothetical protein FJ144_24435 [Deltaproteobacteria bacterium]|nr:hypothetical protein [Deltaproteobacteria bacterium]
MLDWLIIGGGVHGTYLSSILASRLGAGADRIRVLDPDDEPLARWYRCAHNTGMEFLRSPDVHCLGDHPFALHEFAREKRGRALARFTGPYRNQPSLELFRAHVDSIVQERSLGGMRLRGWARRLTRSRRAVRVETDDGTLDARRVVLAIGSTRSAWPWWAVELRAAGARVGHIFDRDFCRASLAPWTRAVVVGGGISAAQTALALASRGHGAVTLLTRHELREQNFDAHPCWFGGCLGAFARLFDPGLRRALIRRERNRGTVPPAIARELRRHVDEGRVEVRLAAVRRAQRLGAGLARLDLGDAGTLEVDLVVLATGFDPARPGGDWLDRAVDELPLSSASCGYPLVDGSLHWGHGIHVMGPLAELEIGPAARNIIGARLAAERLMAVA